MINTEVAGKRTGDINYLEQAMTKWMSGTRGMSLVVLLWIIGWGFGFGGLIELLIDPDGNVQDVWLTVMAVPGFVGGVLFAGLLRLSDGGHRFDDTSFPHIATLGFATGIALGIVGIATGIADDLTEGAEVIGSAVGLSIVAAIGTAIFFRLVAWWGTSRIAGPAD